MADMTDRRIDRLLAGDLSAADQRRLAQASLDDPGLFDELIAAAAARSALGEERAARASTREPARSIQEPTRRWPRTAIVSLAAAAAIVLAVGYATWPRRAAPAAPAST